VEVDKKDETKQVSEKEEELEVVNPLRFRNKAVIVTGGASGIGAATVTEFAWEGAKVAIFDINVKAGKELVATLSQRGLKVYFYEVDVSDKAKIIKGIESFVKETGGKIHCLINNAVFFGSKGVNAEPSDFDKSFSVNVTAGATMANACLKYMLAAGGKNCSIVNNASISAHIAQPVRWTYSATKGALVTMTKCMALDLSIHGIRVNSVSPAWIWTPEVAKAAADGGREKWEPIWGKFHMLRRIGEAKEVARTMLFLCSQDASFITATDLRVDGGYLSLSAEGLGEDSKFAGCD